MANDADQNVTVENPTESESAVEVKEETAEMIDEPIVSKLIEEPASDTVEAKAKKVARQRVKVSKGEIKRQAILLILSVWFVNYGLIFYYLPLGGWIMAFQNFKLKKTFFDSLFSARFVGLKKFHFMFETEVLKDAIHETGNIFQALKIWIDKVMFIRTLRNTLGMGILNLVTTFVMAILFAILLNEVKNKLGKKLVQTISYLPHFLSWIIVTAIIRDTLSSTGIINDLLRLFHVIDAEETYNFFMKPLWFWPIVAFANVWKETGWNAIIYLAAITAIDPCLYEAADIDGAGRIAKMRFITLPGIAPTIIILLVMNIGNVLNAGFEIQYLLENGIIQKVSQTIDIYVLQWGISKSDFSLGTAAGMFKSAVSILLIVICNQIIKKTGHGSLF